jgi:exopolysaccharide production protein ExoQ
MNPSLASLICVCGIAGLFYLDRDRSVRTSKALWLPIIYLWIVGSRAVSVWLGVTPSSGTNVQLEGSPLDAAVFGILLAAAIVVLAWRGKPALKLLRANWAILIYFCYCLVSVTWAYHPDVAFKRWIKSLDDIAMVLVIVTDAQPIGALKRLFSRVGFLLLPASVLFIKYFNDLGRAYGPGGEPMNTGVTTNKNALGVDVLIISLGALWNLRALLLDRRAPNRTRRLVAQGTLLVFGLTLFWMADCSTAIACFVIGSGLMMATNLRAFRVRPKRVHALSLAIFVAGGVALLVGGTGDVAHALGRESNLSGRTEIWAAVIPAVSNPLVGDGYESFWIGPNVKKVWRSLVGWWHPEDLNEAHDGYIETYLNLGLVGVCLISLILVDGYRRTAAALRVNPPLGSLMLAYLIVAMVYSITESGFRSPHPMWIFLLLAVVGSTGVTAGLFGGKTYNTLTPRDDTAIGMASSNGLIPEREAVYAASRF